MNNVLITGGLGFIGAHLVRYLQEKNFNPIIVDDFGNGDKWKNYNYLALRPCKIISTNDFYYMNKLEIEEFIVNFNIQCVVHLGAITSTQEKNVDALWENNVNKTINIINNFRSSNVRIIFASSAGVYGAGSLGFNENIKLDTLKPITPYAMTKLEIEKYISYYQDCDFYSIRFFNVWGTGDFHKDDMISWPSKIVNCIYNKLPIPSIKFTDAPNNETPKRDFVYVKDAVRLIYKIINNEHLIKHKTINCGTGIAMEWDEMLNITFDTFKVPLIDRSNNLNKIIKKVPDGYQYFTKADTTILDAMNFKFTKIEDAMVDYMNERRSTFNLSY